MPRPGVKGIKYREVGKGVQTFNDWKKKRIRSGGPNV